MNYSMISEAESEAWVASLQEHFQTTYLDDHGMMIINMNCDGSADYAEPVIADFGDILPFLWALGMHDFVKSQLELAKGRLRAGLYVRDCRIRLFLNHDWLLGLLDLYRQSGNRELLEMAIKGARTIAQGYFSGNLLIDERFNARNWRTWLAPASPFNGGYIELWLDIFRYTGSEEFLGYAERLAGGWVDTLDFNEFGVFSRVHTTRSSMLNRVGVSLSRLRSRLFKDNTNLVWGILALHQHTSKALWKHVLDRWLEGFETYFFNDGAVFLMLDAGLNGYNISIKAGFSSLDLLCDMSRAGVGAQKILYMAQSIADFWLSQQWENGLFPETAGGNEDHLDANVDMVVALAKLYAITGTTDYLDSLTKCRKAILEKHETPLGYCQSVDRNGIACDTRIKIKYQGLLTKLAMLPDNPSGLFDNEELLELLRDR